MRDTLSNKGTPFFYLGKLINLPKIVKRNMSEN